MRPAHISVLRLMKDFLISCWLLWRFTVRVTSSEDMNLWRSELHHIVMLTSLLLSQYLWTWLWQWGVQRHCVNQIKVTLTETDTEQLLRLSTRLNWSIRTWGGWRNHVGVLCLSTGRFSEVIDSVSECPGSDSGSKGPERGSCVLQVQKVPVRVLTLLLWFQDDAEWSVDHHEQQQLRTRQ